MIDRIEHNGHVIGFVWLADDVWWAQDDEYRRKGIEMGFDENYEDAVSWLRERHAETMKEGTSGNHR